MAEITEKERIGGCTIYQVQDAKMLPDTYILCSEEARSIRKSQVACGILFDLGGPI